jgi:chromosome segregation ATPase
MMPRFKTSVLSVLTDHINLIQQKLHQLLKQYELLQQETEKKSASILALQTKLEEQQQSIEELKQTNLILKATTSEMDPVAKKELDTKLQQYIKNIDHCISLLSK